MSIEMFLNYWLIFDFTQHMLYIDLPNLKEGGLYKTPPIRRDKAP